MSRSKNQWPNITNIVFKECCKESIKNIRQNHEIASLINRGIIPLVFLSLFFSPTNSAGQGGGLTLTTGIMTTDWINLYNGIIGINKHIKNLIKEIADFERLDHSQMQASSNNNNLIRFWTAVYDVYSK